MFGNVSFYTSFLSLTPDFWLVESGQGLITSMASSPLYHVIHCLLQKSGSHLLKVFFLLFSFLLSPLLSRAWKCTQAPNGVFFPIIQVILLWRLKAECSLVECFCSESTSCDNTDSSKAFGPVVWRFFWMKSILNIRFDAFICDFFLYQLVMLCFIIILI